MKNIYVIIFLLFFSCAKISQEKKVFLPNEDNEIQIFDSEITYKDIYSLEKTVLLPDFVGNVYRIASSNGNIFFNDENAIYTYEPKNNKVIEYYNPIKGRGPGEVSSIFRFEIINNSYIIIANYPEKNLVFVDLINDTSYTILTEFDSGLISLSNKKSFLAYNSSHPSGNMFQELSISGKELNQFGNYFTNQNKSLDLLNSHTDSYNGENIVIGFNSVGYFIGLNEDGSTKFFVESSIYPGFIPIYVTRNGYSFFDTQQKMISNSLTVGETEFHVFTRLLANKEKIITASSIDVFDVHTGKYKYSYKLEKEILEFEILNDSTLIAITPDHELVFWEK